MAYCNSGCSGCGASGTGGGSNHTRVGALGSLCRSCGCSSNYMCNACNSCNSCNLCGCSGGHRDPFYTGPCPPAPCNGCGCESAETCGCCTRNAGVSGAFGSAHDRCGHCESHCGGHHGDDCRRHTDACYGVFTVNGPFHADDGTIVLRTRDADLKYFTLKGGGISLHRSGVYQVFITVDIPTGMSIDTLICMELDGRRMSLPELAVTSDSHTATHNYAAGTIFHADSGAILKLVSRQPLACPHTTDHPLITLTLIKVG